MSKKNLNGITNIDTAQMEEMRKAVVEQELSARSWKAWYEKMYYSMESEKLEVPYKEYQERMRIRIEEENKRREEFIKLMSETSINNKDGELKVESVEQHLGAQPLGAQPLDYTEPPSTMHIVKD